MILALALILLHNAAHQQAGEALEVSEPSARVGALEVDWLLAKEGFEARTSRTDHSVIDTGELATRREIALENGLVRRKWQIEPGAATIELAVGGLRGQPDYAYLRPEWLTALEPDPRALHLVRYEVGPTVAPFDWKRVRHAV